MKSLIDKLHKERILSHREFEDLITNFTKNDMEYLFSMSRAVADSIFGKKIFVRGIIEFSNFCKNNCHYCGIRRGNQNVRRYRLTKDEILSCCKQGYQLGIRTFVLQGGEDLWYSQDKMVDIVSSIRAAYPDCAITLSIGEKTYDEYLSLFEAGANRFLLRHETASAEHYSRLHPSELSIENRKRCLHHLKRIGYQTGAGFMVGAPYQTVEHIIEDLYFLKELQPEMIGIGPFIPHKDTVFASFPSGTVEMTLLLLGILRLMFPNVMLPATTALGTIHPSGRELGILAGANVVMPNISPLSARGKYELYDNKICTNEEAIQCIPCLKRRLETIGYEMVVDRGDFKPVAPELVLKH